MQTIVFESHVDRSIQIRHRTLRRKKDIYSVVENPLQLLWKNHKLIFRVKPQQRQLQQPNQNSLRSQRHKRNGPAAQGDTWNELNQPVGRSDS
jgi:hypothetical protein